MMTFKIHFTHKDIEDSFVVSGEEFVDIRYSVALFFAERGLDKEECSVWSEEVEE